MSPARSNPKTRRPRRRAGHRWPDDVRERALELIRGAGGRAGIAAAHTELGIPKATLSRWARDAGIDLTASAARTHAATTVRAATLAADTTTRLEYLIELASGGLTRRLEANLDAAELDDDDLGTWDDELERFVGPGDGSAAALALRRYRHLSTLEPTRDLVGTLTRAVHDLALLRGEATERGDVVVRFGIPRPQTPADVRTVETGDD